MTSYTRADLSTVFAIYVPSELVLVGADVDNWVDFSKQAGVDQTLYIEADERKIERVESAGILPEGWSAYHALLYSESKDVAYYHLSNPRLNGIVEAERLQPLWRNLKTRESVVTPSTTLSKLLQDMSSVDKGSRCIVIECFGSLEILKGSGKVLDSTEVILSKVTLKRDPSLREIGKEILDDWLLEKGFRFISFTPEAHPDVGMALYIRDEKGRNERLSVELDLIKDEKRDLAEALERQTAQSATVRKEKRALEDQLKAKVAELENLRKKVAKAEERKNELVVQLEKRATEMESLRQTLQSKTEEYGKTIEGLKRSNAALQNEKEALAKEKGELTARKEKCAKELQSLMQSLEAKTKESQRLAAELKAAGEEKRSLMEALEKQMARAETFRKEKETLEAQLKASGAELENLRKKSAKMEKRKIELEAELKNKIGEIDNLSTLYKKRIKEHEEFKNKLKLTNGYFENRKKEAIEAKKKIALLEEKIAKSSQYSSDAKIDTFINDITPFFYGKSITYVDIGAYIGEVFMKMMDIGKIRIREAHLFEPNPESYEILRKNLQEYSLSSLHTYNIALGKKEGKSVFTAAKSMTKEYKNTNGIIDNATGLFEANIKVFDDLSSLITEEHIHILKIDTEGNELNVFEGAKNLLERQQVDVIYMEVGFNKEGKQQTYFCKIDEFLQKYGYRVFKFYEQAKEWIEDMPYLRRANVAYISSKFATENPHKLTLENYKLKREIDKLRKREG